jgi:hypothetical protein
MDKILFGSVFGELFRLQISNFLGKYFEIFMDYDFLAHLTSAAFIV